MAALLRMCAQKQTKMRLTWTYRGTQFGDVLSTSQVANNFIGTGRWGVQAAETSRRIPPESAMLSWSHIVLV